ncbi:MAG: hypothetical protein AAGG51_12620 [Cyanobacteria bacterium P01_G01_bin.54]
MLKSLFLSALLLTLPLAPVIALVPDPHELRNTNEECDPKLEGHCAHRGDFPWDEAAALYVLSPRRSRLLNPQPRLRWLPVSGATHYTVRLLQDIATADTETQSILPEHNADTKSQVIWTAQTSDTEIRYDGEMLQPGLKYRVEVTTETITDSSAEALPTNALIFSIVSAADREAIQSQVAELRQTTADPDEQQWAVADLYVEQGLVNEAIALLEDLQSRQPENAALLVRLGNLYYRWLLLVEPSQGYYEQALQVAGEEPSLARAVALEQLGHLQVIQLQPEAAIASFQAAQEVYRALGDRAAATALDRQIDGQQRVLQP